MPPLFLFARPCDLPCHCEAPTGPWQSPGTIHRNAQQKQTWYREIPTGLPALGMTSKFATASNHRVIARSGATWQSPGTIHRSAQQKQTWYREIPTGLTALGMTSKFATASNHRVIARSEATWQSPSLAAFSGRKSDIGSRTYNINK